MNAASASKQETLVPEKSPTERYAEAGRNWDLRTPYGQEQALEEYRALVAEGVDLAGPYKALVGFYAANGGVANIDSIVDVHRRAFNCVTDERDYFREMLVRALYIQGTVRWDDEKLMEAFEAYFEGLKMEVGSEADLRPDAPRERRIAFAAARSFSLEFHRQDVSQPAVQFLEFCEERGIDPNFEVFRGDFQ